MKVKYLSHASMLLAASILLCGLSTGSAYGNGITPYKVSMDRIDPEKPIRKSAIMSTIRKKFPGRILSIREKRTGGPDCHIVKSMGQDGEFRIIHVACTE